MTQTARAPLSETFEMDPQDTVTLSSTTRGERIMLVAGVERIARAWSIDESCRYGAYLAVCAAFRPRRSTCGTLDKDF